MRNPRVAVGLPVHNGERYLQPAIESVLEQTYEDLELIISDNASTDRTAEICRDYLASDRRIRYVRSAANIGAVPNFNRVFALSRAPFFKWLSYDDRCHPQLLSRCLEVFDEAPRAVSLVYPRCEMIDAHGGFRGQLVEDVASTASSACRRLRRVLLKRRSAQALLGVIRSEHLRRTRLRQSCVMDDMALLAELALVGQFRRVDEVLLQVRIHPENATTTHTTTRAHAVWLDPANAGARVVLRPAIRLFCEAFRSVWHLSLPAAEKIACSVAVLDAYAERPLRRVAGRWRRRLSPRLVSARTGGGVAA